MSNISLDFSRSRLQPFQHQREDVEWLLEQPYAFIASEMRTGKTKIVIDAVQFLYERGLVDAVVVVTPAPVRDVWFDPDIGELAKHLWNDLSSVVIEYHTKPHVWFHGPKTTTSFKTVLRWHITNFEFIRSKSNLQAILKLCGPQTILIGDESSFLKNHDSQQTKSFMKLRRRCGRVVLLNGTPIYHSPIDLYSQGNILNESILDCKYVSQFKARYAIQKVVYESDGKGGGQPLVRKGVVVQTVTGWTNLDDLQRRFAPYTVRRLQAECLDLPPKLDNVTLTAKLSPATWRSYRHMRDQLVIWLENNQAASAKTAAIKIMRLSQITSGFVGGVEDVLPPEDAANVQFSLDGENLSFQSLIEPTTETIGQEKLDVLLWFIKERLEQDPNLHLVVWCRFRPELIRMMDAVAEKFPQFTFGTVMGGQSRDERLMALSLLKPETSPKGPVFVGGIEGTGSFGLDFTASHTCVTMSSGYSPGRVKQTLDRVYGPGQDYPVAYFSIVATGPAGQRTIDHVIELARRNGEDTATWTASAWVKAIKRE